MDPPQHSAPIWRVCQRPDWPGQHWIHSHARPRFMCTQCHKTFSATKARCYYRLRTAAETVALVVTCSPMAVLWQLLWRRLDSMNAPSPIGARSGRQGQAVQESWSNSP